TINTVQNTAMTGHKLATILYMRLTLNERFSQVAKSRGHSDQQAKQDGQVPGDIHRQASKEHGCSHRENQTTQNPLPGFTGANPGSQLMPPEEMSREKRSTIKTPDTCEQSRQPPESMTPSYVRAAQDQEKAHWPAQV